MMPTISDFGKILENNDLKDRFDALYRFINKIKSSSNDSISEIYDVEKLLTIVLSKNLYRDLSESQFYDRVKDDVLKYVAFLIKDLYDRKLNDSVFYILHFFVQLNRTKQGSIISFNYDTLIEDACQFPIHSCVNPYQEEQIKHSSLTKLELIKLHGSLDWYKTLGSPNIELETVKIVKETSYYYPIHKNQSPVFIPMSHNKDAFFKGSLFNTLWAKAMSNLEEADEVIFIGYGFPRTDVNNLMDFLAFKDKIKHIVVYNCPHKELARLRNIFGGCVLEKDAKDYVMDLIIENFPNEVEENGEIIRSHMEKLKAYEASIRSS